MLSREKLEARLADAKNQSEQLKQQLFLTLGAVADLEFLLDEDKKSEEPSATTAPLSSD